MVGRLRYGTAAADATAYRLLIYRDGQEYASAWREGKTYRTFGKLFPYGRYRWWVQAWKSDGYGPWSHGMNFEVGVARPVAPAGMQTGAPHMLRWDDRGSYGAASYRLYINSTAGVYWNEWMKVGTTVGDGDDRYCYLPAGITPLPVGPYRWWVQARHPDYGYGPWSEGMDFQVP